MTAATKHGHTVIREPATDVARRIAWLLQLLATVQLVWFYHARVPPALDILAYEQGLERTPFQQRMLLMAPLRWAHHSSLCRQGADFLNRAHGWFGVSSGHIRPEGMLDVGVDLGCVLFTGLIARRMYQAASRTRLLTECVYPLVLVMVLVTYAIQVNHPLGFLYDLPAMAFFSCGLYLLYFRRSTRLFAVLFIMATINRETTLLLLPAWWLAQARPETGPHPQQWQWARLLRFHTMFVTIALLGWWVGWHTWVVRHFASNVSASGPRLLLNLGTLLVPLSWPQLCSAAAYAWPLTILYRRLILDATLRAWIWLPALWLVFMLGYGLIIETRIFGELIAYFACSTALIAEQLIAQAFSVPAVSRPRQA